MSLTPKMRELADSGHERAADLRQAAKALDDAIDDALSVQIFLARWARAWRIWCECIGEPLV